MDSEENNENKPTHKPTTSPTDLFSSAKELIGASQSAFRQEDFDKSKAAGAADELLNAASEYGKLEEKGYGQYVDKAETYLHKFSGGSDTTTTTTTTTTTPEAESKPSGDGGDESREKSEGGGGGFGDYMKVAQGFLK